MLVDVDRTLSAETLRRMAREHVQLDLTDREVEALLPLLRSLLAEIGHIEPADRAGAEPEFLIVLEPWRA